MKTTEQQYNDARAEVARAREAFNNAKTKTAKREAAAGLEFWTNKAAFLWNACGRPVNA